MLETAVNEARADGQQEKDKIISSAREEAQKLVTSAKERVRVQIDESSKLMMEIHQKMQQMIGTAGLEMNAAHNDRPNVVIKPHKAEADILEKLDFSPIKKEIDFEAELNFPTEIKTEIKPDIPAEPKTSTVNKVNNIFVDEENHNYHGQFKIDIAPPVENGQLSQLVNDLGKTEHLQVINKGELEDGSAWIEISISKPIPLMDILKNLPEVKDVVGCKSYIILALKAATAV